jgi:pimeloyl-ACP methyl ester carboxylesterase
MIAAISLAGLIALSPAVELPIMFWGISPEAKDPAAISQLKPKQTRAVVVVHGLLPRPLHPERANLPDPHSWQNPKGELVKLLVASADVYGVSYAQTVPVDLVALSKGLRDGIAALKSVGYQEIILVGHSAGGIIVRSFASTFPESGVTKVVTVAAPHTGSGWTNFPMRFWPKPQIPFIESLAEGYRAVATRDAKPFPKELPVCCIVCKLPRLDSDTMVGVKSQWPPDLQTQGIPAILVRCHHFEAMTNADSIKAMTEAVNGKLLRWSGEETEKAQRILFGEKK